MVKTAAEILDTMSDESRAGLNGSSIGRGLYEAIVRGRGVRLDSTVISVNLRPRPVPRLLCSPSRCVNARLTLTRHLRSGAMAEPHRFCPKASECAHAVRNLLDIGNEWDFAQITMGPGVYCPHKRDHNRYAEQHAELTRALWAVVLEIGVQKEKQQR